MKNISTKLKELQQEKADLVPPKKLTSTEEAILNKGKKRFDTKMEELNSQIERYSPGFAQKDQWRSETSYTGFKGTDNAEARKEFNDKIESKKTQYDELSNPVNFDQRVNQQAASSYQHDLWHYTRRYKFSSSNRKLSKCEFKDAGGRPRSCTSTHSKRSNHNFEC